jgi:hypothetical protein
MSTRPECPRRNSHNSRVECLFIGTPIATQSSLYAAFSF